jgi:hypothetical protein
MQGRSVATCICGPKGRDSIAQAEGLGTESQVEKKAQRAVTSGWRDISSVNQGCAPLGLSILIGLGPRPLAWAIESRPFGPNDTGFTRYFTENRIK